MSEEKINATCITCGEKLGENVIYDEKEKVYFCSVACQAKANGVPDELLEHYAQSDRLTDEQLAEIKERWGKITGEAIIMGSDDDESAGIINSGYYISTPPNNPSGLSYDAACALTSAPQDVPALIAEIDALTGDRDRLFRENTDLEVKLHAVEAEVRSLVYQNDLMAAALEEPQHGCQRAPELVTAIIEPSTEITCTTCGKPVGECAISGKDTGMYFCSIACEKAHSTPADLPDCMMSMLDSCDGRLTPEQIARFESELREKNGRIGLNYYEYFNVQLIDEIGSMRRDYALLQKAYADAQDRITQLKAEQDPESNPPFNGKFIQEVARLESEFPQPNLAALLLQRRQIDLLERIAEALEGPSCEAGSLNLRDFASEQDALFERVKVLEDERVKFRQALDELQRP